MGTRGDVKDGYRRWPDDILGHLLYDYNSKARRLPHQRPQGVPLTAEEWAEADWQYRNNKRFDKKVTDEVTRGIERTRRKGRKGDYYVPPLGVTRDVPDVGM